LLRLGATALCCLPPLGLPQQEGVKEVRQHQTRETVEEEMQKEEAVCMNIMMPIRHHTQTRATPRSEDKVSTDKPCPNVRRILFLFLSQVSPVYVCVCICVWDSFFSVSACGYLSLLHIRSWVFRRYYLWVGWMFHNFYIASLLLCMNVYINTTAHRCQNILGVSDVREVCGM